MSLATNGSANDKNHNYSDFNMSSSRVQNHNKIPIVKSEHSSSSKSKSSEYNAPPMVPNMTTKCYFMPGKEVKPWNKEVKVSRLP